MNSDVERCTPLQISAGRPHAPCCPENVGREVHFEGAAPARSLITNHVLAYYNKEKLLDDGRMRDSQSTCSGRVATEVLGH